MVWSKRRFPSLFSLRNGYIWRHYATARHDPSKVRNMALVAHIGLYYHCISAHVFCLTVLTRLGENHAHGIYTFKILIYFITWHCRHRKYDYWLSSCWTRTGHHCSISKHSGSMERVDFQSHWYTRTCRLWHGGRKRQSCGRWRRCFDWLCGRCGISDKGRLETIRQVRF